MNMIRKKNERVKRRGIKVNFCCVPAHTGVPGNEYGDEIARRTANENLLRS